MNVGIRIAINAFGLIHASFIGIVAAELASPIIGWVMGALALGLSILTTKKLGALITKTQAQVSAQETQA